jgi:RNA polymerase sigma factor (sigma-70 family)
VKSKRLEILQIRDFYKIHKQKLVVYACSITRNMTDAEDVVHSAFVKILQKIQSSGFFPDDLKAFIYRTAHNEAIDKLRSAKDTVPIEHFPIDNPVSDNAENLLVYRVLNDGLAKLDQNAREVIMLKAYAGLSFREISQVINISAFTVATQYYRAVRKLKKIMESKREN